MPTQDVKGVESGMRDPCLYLLSLCCFLYWDLLLVISTYKSYLLRLLSRLVPQRDQGGLSWLNQIVAIAVIVIAKGKESLMRGDEFLNR